MVPSNDTLGMPGDEGIDTNALEGMSVDSVSKIMLWLFIKYGWWCVQCSAILEVLSLILGQRKIFFSLICLLIILKSIILK